MRPTDEFGGVALYRGDAADVLRSLPDASFDAVVTDPPAGIKFMGKKWDDPGSFVERRPDRANKWDMVGGNHNPTDAFDRARTARAERKKFVAFLSEILAECLRVTKPGGRLLCWSIPRTSHWTGTAVEDAGWEVENVIAHLFSTGFPKGKSQLKPAREDWWLARKPAPRVLPLSIDACRVGTTVETWPASRGYSRHDPGSPVKETQGTGEPPPGRWPANVCHDGSPEVLEAFAEFGERDGRNGVTVRRQSLGYHGNGSGSVGVGYQDAGTAARFFYCAKPDGGEREPPPGGTRHPTQKSLELMRWLCRLVAGRGGRVLDPFLGSGTTGVAALIEGMDFAGVERDPGYYATALARLKAADGDGSLFAGVRQPGLPTGADE
jgi:DNA modification methylase